MSVYVGKDVQITLQMPVEREPHKIPDAEPYTVTLLNTPISDRDMDGVADENEHVTVVDKDGNAITPGSVDDSEGTITFDAADAGKTVYITYRYDSAPYVAQELSLEPKQRIEGLDGLGSDVIQVWTVLQKEIDGSIKEAFQHGNVEQLARTALPHVFVETFEDADRWEPQSGSWSVTGSKEYGGGSAPAYSVIKNWKIKNFYARFKVKVTGTSNSIYGLTYRYIDGGNLYLFGIHPSDDEVILYKRVNNTSYIVASTAVIIDTNIWYTLECIVIDDKLTGLLNGEVMLEATDTSFLNSGRIGFGINNTYATALFDDLRIESPYLRGDEYGIIVSWEQAGQAIKIGLDGAVFPEGSIPAPKNEPVYVVTPFKAKSIKLIT